MLQYDGAHRYIYFRSSCLLMFISNMSYTDRACALSVVNDKETL